MFSINQFNFFLNKIHNNKLLLILLLLLYTNYTEANSLSKDTLKNAILGWHFGLNFGSYFADKTPALFYNGSGENNLKSSIIDNQYNYNAIKNVVHYDFAIDSNTLPKNMKYNPAMMLGFNAQYNFRKTTGYFIEFNYAKLRTSDVFTLVVDSFNSTSEPSLRQGMLTGKEERVDINLGLHQTFGKLKKIKPFLEYGLNFNNVKVLESLAQVANMNYSLVSPYNLQYKVVQGGVAFGLFGGAGVQAIFGQSFIMEVGTALNYKKIHLGDNPKFKFQKTIYIRVLLKNVFSTEEE